MARVGKLFMQGLHAKPMHVFDDTLGFLYVPFFFFSWLLFVACFGAALTLNNDPRPTYVRAALLWLCSYICYVLGFSVFV